MSIRNIRGGILLSILILLLSACLSGSREGFPDWVLVRPNANGEDLFFVSKGSSRTADQDQARRQAEQRLIESVLDEMGLDLDEDASAEYLEEVLNYRRQLEQELHRTNGNNRLHTEDQFLREYPDGRIDLYLLAVYPRRLLEEKRREFSLLKRSPQDLVTALEAEGEEYREAGDYYAAVLSFLDAAAATRYLAEPERGAEQLKLLQAARAAAAIIRILPLSAGINGVEGRSFEKPFEVRVLYMGDGNEVGADGVSLVADFPVSAGEELGREQQRLRSGSDGLVSFLPPAPDYSGSAVLTIGLDFNESVSAINVSPEAALEMSRFESTVDKLRAVFPFQVRQPAIGIRTAIYIIDSDLSGNPTGRRDSAAGIAGALSAEGYDLELVEGSPDLIAGSSEEILPRLREAYGSAFNRVVYGRARIVAFSEEDGKFSVTVSAALRAIELPSGRILYLDEEIKRSVIGSNSQSAINSAFRQLGKAVGEALTSRL